MSRCRGSIIWFNNTMGFGFIQRTDGPDVFCHGGALRMEDRTHLRDGAEVEFDISGPDERHVDNVVLIRR